MLLAIDGMLLLPKPVFVLFAVFAALVFVVPTTCLYICNSDASFVLSKVVFGTPADCKA